MSANEPAASWTAGIFRLADILPASSRTPPLGRASQWPRAEPAPEQSGQDARGPMRALLESRNRNPRRSLSHSLILHSLFFRPLHLDLQILVLGHEPLINRAAGIETALYRNVIDVVQVGHSDLDPAARSIPATTPACSMLSTM